MTEPTIAKGTICNWKHGLRNCIHPAKYAVAEYTWQGPTGRTLFVCGVHRNENDRSKGRHDRYAAQSKAREERLARLNHANKVGKQLEAKLSALISDDVKLLASQDGHSLLLSVAQAEVMAKCLDG